MTSSGLGSLLGMRHALEPDHLAAVSTLVSGERSGYKAALLGACWGLGHTLALVAVGVVVVMLRAEMPVRVSNLFEFGVAIMLVGLGVRAIYLAARQGPAGPTRAHHHGRTVHVHSGATGAHSHRRLDAGAPAAARRRRARSRRQRRADGARPDDIADYGGAPHLHGALRAGLDAGDGRALGAAWAGRWRAWAITTRSRAPCRWPSASSRPCSASTTASLHRYCPTDRDFLRRITDLVVARLKVDGAGDRQGRSRLRRLVEVASCVSRNGFWNTGTFSSREGHRCRPSDTSPCRTSTAPAARA